MREEKKCSEKGIRKKGVLALSSLQPATKAKRERESHGRREKEGKKKSIVKTGRTS
jgi:hypothetical protein